MLIDTHSHLTLSEKHLPIPEHIGLCREKGVKYILDAGVELDDFTERKTKLAQYPEVLLGAAIAPHSMDRHSLADADRLDDLISREKPVAISEIGLEYYHYKDNHDKQRELFRAQLKLAAKHDLPVFLHIRDAYDDAYEEVLKSGVTRGAVHCFTGKPDDAARFTEIGFMISFSGIVTFKKSTEIQEALRRTAVDKILTETDSPYLSPEPLRGRPNNSSNVYLVNEFAGGIKKISLPEMNSILADNAKKLLGIRE